jgi:hypothetical protein
MSVRPETFPEARRLVGSEGELVSVQISVEPRHLEGLLDLLCQVGFPINPQIFHQAGVGHVFPDGTEEVAPATIVEFPVFSRRLNEIRRLIRSGVPGACSLHVGALLDEIDADRAAEPAPDGAPYRRIHFYKHRPAAAGRRSG